MPVTVHSLYGAPLNAIVLLDAYRADPDDLHLLETGLGGVLGSVTSIAEGSGVASMGWHGAECGCGSGGKGNCAIGRNSANM